MYSYRLAFAVIILIAGFTSSFCQTSPAQPFSDTLSYSEKVAIFRKTLSLTEPQQKRFEEIYHAYSNEQKRTFRCSFLTLDNLAKFASGVNQAEALDCLNTLLVNGDIDRRTRDKYFDFIKREIDPKTADQFLKLETGFEKAYENILRRKVLASIDLPSTSANLSFRNGLREAYLRLGGS